MKFYLIISITACGPSIEKQINLYSFSLKTSVRALYSPTSQPGILYNSIKSGLAVDYPIYKTNRPVYSAPSIYFSGSLQTNATQVAEAATAGNLTDIGAAINAEDTPDIASAVEAQKMEEVLSEETPRQSRPDQSLPGPPFPGAWGTVE